MPATQDLQKMEGTVDVVPEVRQLYSFAAAHVTGSIDVQLDFIWQSRESDALLHADMLSRLKNSSEVFLSYAAVKRVIPYYACKPATVSDGDSL